MGMSKTALLLVDLQNEVLHNDGTLCGDLRGVAPGLLDATRALIAWARERTIPVIWVRMAYRTGYVDASRWIRDLADDLAGRLVEGTWGAEIIDGLGREPDDIVITKKRSSAFFATDLDMILRSLDVQHIVVGGTSTNWAVEGTARDAESLDYRVTVVREATGCRIQKMHEPALLSIASRYGEVSSLSQILALGG
jgi:nicotinamidase-related amidase